MMQVLSDFAITARWPARHPDRIQLYSRPTPNGVKVSIMLEETGLPYEAHSVNSNENEQKTAEFLSLNPYGKIPAIIDPHGPGGALGLFESVAILFYLGEKTGRFMPADAAGRYETLQWLVFQAAGVGPTFGQIGFFHKAAGKDFEDKRPRDRFAKEGRRLLGALEQRLLERRWILGEDYSIADIAVFPWVRNLIDRYGAGELVGIVDFPNVTRAYQAFMSRPAVIRGLDVPPRAMAA